MSRRVEVLGPLPPPFGGVSIHIVRFLELLRAEGLEAVGHPYTGTTRQGKLGKLIQAGRMLVKLYATLRPRANDVLHLHYGGLGYFLAIAPILQYAKGRKVVTFHSVRIIHDLAERPNWVRRLTLYLLGGFDLFVPVRAEIGEELAKLGVRGPAVTVMPAFLPPSAEEGHLDRLSDVVAENLLAGMEAGRQQVCCAAYYLGAGYGQSDLYGVEALLSVLPMLDKGPAWDLWVLVSNRPETAEQRNAESAIMAAASSLEHINLQLHYGLPLIPVMARCGAFLRPSREDGDSVAVREAMSLGLPVLASDVVSRPDGVFVFSMDDDETFGLALKSFLSDLPVLKPGQVRSVVPGDQKHIHDFVREVAGLSGEEAAR